MTKKDTEDIIKRIKEGAKAAGLKALEGKEADKFMKDMQARFPETQKKSAEIMKKLKPYEGKYKWLPGMSEISGFGGTYEEACRRMVQRGLEWHDHYQNKRPRWKGLSGVYGLIDEDNADAKELNKVMMDASYEIDPDGGGSTGAMYQASVNAIMYVRKNGWDAYVREMSNENKK